MTRLKKVVLALIVLFSCIYSQEASASEKFIWDGSEIVEGQIGKMTFSKDVKVYKKVKDSGDFTSMVVKRNNYFRVYGKEVVGEHTYLWMSGGYRVQLTDLVVYKELPRDIIEKVSGSKLINGETVYVSSKGGLSIKAAPNANAKTLHRVPYQTVLIVKDFSGDYVQVRYRGHDYDFAGYVAKDYVASLPNPKTKYIKETVIASRQPNYAIHGNSGAVTLGRGQEVKTYFTTSNGLTLVTSKEGVTGFVPSTELSTKKIVNVPISILKDPTLIALNPLKGITYSRYQVIDSYASGVYNPEKENHWKGNINHSTSEVSYYKASDFTMAVTKDNIVYTIDDSTITIPFPLKVGSKIISHTEGFQKEEHVVDRMLDRYTFNNGETIENVIFAGPMSDNEKLGWNLDYSIILGKSYIQFYYDFYKQE